MRLRNFLSYGEQIDPLDFDSVHLACLSGNNGNGKSALLDAILWALWGQSRASGHRGIAQEGLINHGKSEMEVEFRFDIAGQTYLVFRRLEMRGSNRSPKTSLSLFLQGDGGFIPIGGDSVREVQKSIDEVLQLTTSLCQLRFHIARESRRIHSPDSGQAEGYPVEPSWA